MTAPSKPHDALVLFELTSKTLDNKPKWVKSGYRPEYEIQPGYWTCAHHEFENEGGVFTGETVRTRIWFLTPEIYPHTLWVGRVLPVAEGSRVIGRATIVEVCSALLLSLDEGPIDFS